MAGLHKTNDESSSDDSAREGIGDVEEAGETTAADTVSGPVDTRPVGTDTMVKVSGEPGKDSDGG